MMWRCKAISGLPNTHVKAIPDDHVKVYRYFSVRQSYFSVRQKSKKGLLFGSPSVLVRLQHGLKYRQPNNSRRKTGREPTKVVRSVKRFYAVSSGVISIPIHYRERNPCGMGTKRK